MSLTLSALLLLTTLTTACGSMSAQSKRKLGMRPHTLTLRDLGPAYAPFINTALDPFEPTEVAKSKGKGKSKDKASAKGNPGAPAAAKPIKYNTYKLKNLDDSLKRSNALYGEFIFMSHAVEALEHANKQLFGRADPSFAEATSAIARAKTSKKTSVERVRLACEAARFSQGHLPELINSSTTALSELMSVHEGATQQLSAHPDRVLLAPDLLKDVKETTKRLKLIPSEGSKTTQRLAKMRGELALCARLF